MDDSGGSGCCRSPQGLWNKQTNKKTELTLWPDAGVGWGGRAAWSGTCPGPRRSPGGGNSWPPAQSTHCKWNDQSMRACQLRGGRRRGGAQGVFLFVIGAFFELAGWLPPGKVTSGDLRWRWRGRGGSRAEGNVFSWGLFPPRAGKGSSPSWDCSH